VKKILGLTISALLVMALVAGGTYAYFSDQQVSTGNVFSAGTLDVGLANTSTPSSTGNTTATFSTVTNWAPGGTKTGTLFINNNGTLPIAHLNVTFSYGAVDYSGHPSNITGGAPMVLLNDTFDKMISATNATWTVPVGGTPKTVSAIEGKTLLDLKTNGAIPLDGLYTLAGPQEGVLSVTFTFNANATNGCQGNKVDVTVTVDGYQN
jgi:predicted ribosomally synthesized peptide with SipW-like signal peptide